MRPLLSLPSPRGHLGTAVDLVGVLRQRVHTFPCPPRQLRGLLRHACLVGHEAIHDAARANVPRHRAHERSCRPPPGHLATAAAHWREPLCGLAGRFSSCPSWGLVTRLTATRFRSGSFWQATCRQRPAGCAGIPACADTGTPDCGRKKECGKKKTVGIANGDVFRRLAARSLAAAWMPILEKLLLYGLFRVHSGDEGGLPEHHQRKNPQCASLVQTRTSGRSSRCDQCFC